MLTLTLCYLGCQSQASFTMSIGDLDSAPSSLEDVAWIAGSWQGEAFGGHTEEIWSEPSAGSMMGSFKLVNEGEISFYEFMTISEVDHSLILKIKHFDAALTGWEEKDETVDFKFIKQEGNRTYFDELTFEKVDDQHMNVYVVIKEGDTSQEVKFAYQRN